MSAFQKGKKLVFFIYFTDLHILLAVLSDILIYVICSDSGATWWFSFQYQWIIGVRAVFHFQQYLSSGRLSLLLSNYHDSDVLLWNHFPFCQGQDAL